MATLAPDEKRPRWVGRSPPTNHQLLKHGSAITACVVPDGGWPCPCRVALCRHALNAGVSLLRGLVENTHPSPYPPFPAALVWRRHKGVLSPRSLGLIEMLLTSTMRSPAPVWRMRVACRPSCGYPLHALRP